MRIGILTGGGDVPGLNPCIKAVVNRAEENGWEVVGIRRGWGGLLHYDLDERTAVAGEWHRAADPPMCPDDRPLRRDTPAHLADQSA